MDEKTTTSQQTKIIPALPTSEIFLKVTEIAPLDVFYSPLHKVVARGQRKRRRTKASLVVTPGDIPMDILWKDTQTDPSNNLTKLSQFVGAYAFAMIDKAIEV